MEKLDNFDRSILRVLQADGKIGNQDLAEKVNLSSSPCWRRVRKLEDSGVIDSYVAMLNPKSLGLTAMAYVHIALLDHRQKTIETLDNFVATQDQIIECSSITGSNDYLLKIISNDLLSYESFIKQSFGNLRCVSSIESTVVLKQTFSRQQLPLIKTEKKMSFF